MRALLLLSVLPACQFAFPLSSGDSPEDGSPPPVPPDIGIPPDVGPLEQGLVLHLTFDDGGDLKADARGNLVSCVGVCDLQVDDHENNPSAMRFNGTTCLSIASTPALSPASISIALWARQPDAPTTAETMIARLLPPSLATSYEIASTLTNWTFAIGNAKVGPTSSSDGVWHHVALVYAPGSLQIFVDGTGVTAIMGQGLVYTEAATTIGCRTTTPGDATAHFNGDLDDVRIYDRQLTLQEVQDLAKGR